jgi:hypothetical protein
MLLTLALRFFSAFRILADAGDVLNPGVEAAALELQVVSCALQFVKFLRFSSHTHMRALQAVDEEFRRVSRLLISIFTKIVERGFHPHSSHPPPHSPFVVINAALRVRLGVMCFLPVADLLCRLDFNGYFTAKKTAAS